MEANDGRDSNELAAKCREIATKAGASKTEATRQRICELDSAEPAALNSTASNGRRSFPECFSAKEHEARATSC
eukprot:2886496-Pleurochrysis_carterae.AAC.1